MVFGNDAVPMLCLSVLVPLLLRGVSDPGQVRQKHPSTRQLQCWLVFTWCHVFLFMLCAVQADDLGNCIPQHGCLRTHAL
jgi:ABC-type transport system involved in cytochrome c biogenesis permease component